MSSSMKRYGRIAFFILVLSAAARARSPFPMYQGNMGEMMQSVLSDDTYQSIYLQYHGCVWSEYEDGSGQGGCGGDGSGDNWYMGQTQCFRANVAYSLYGVAKGEEAPSNPCQKKQFVNSFFTTHGVDQFSYSMGLDNGSATSSCSVYNYGTASQSGYPTNNQQLYPDYTSTTTACASDGTFVQALFQGAYCSRRERGETLDFLEQENRLFGVLNCVEKYDASSQNGQGSYQNNYQGRHLDEQNNNIEVEPLYDLLAYSQICSTSEYPSECKDPFHIKSKMEYQPVSQSWWKHLNWMDYVTISFLFFAALFALIPCCDGPDDDDDDSNASSKRGGLCLRFRRRRRSKQADTSGERKGGLRGWFRRRVLRQRS